MIINKCPQSDLFVLSNNSDWVWGLQFILDIEDRPAIATPLSHIEGISSIELNHTNELHLKLVVVSELFELFLCVLISDFTLSAKTKYDQNWQSFASLGVEGKHLFYSYLSLFLYLLVLVLYVGVGIDLYHKSQS